ncbi:MAG: bifunctional shikimate kinase/shikimate dehydrogenase [Methanospirillum sp.]|nr:bifunctional shikimate kinase/shikimate dehydrogenase [Methanospirillum sp.]
MKVILIGFRGTGKTTVGRLVAERLGLPFLDTDALVEARAGRPIPAIFEAEGEEGFRRLERQVCAGLAGAAGVIATGGGAVLDPANVEALRRGARVVLLEASPEEIAARCAGGDRPALTPLGPFDEVRALLAARAGAYRAAADCCVWTGCRAPGEVAGAVLAALDEKPSPSDRAALAALNPVPGEAARVDAALARGAGLCAVLGHPVAHSRSPALFARLFDCYGLPYAYTRVDHPDPGEAVRLARRCGARGLSVTVPHKEAAAALCDSLAPDAARIGAVNTIVQCGGRLHGANTDWLGVRAPLAHLAGRGCRATVLGAGGVAASAVFALQDLGMAVTVLARNPARAAALAARFGAVSGPLSAFDPRGTDVVVNATPVGMAPNTGCLLEEEDLGPGMIVFDLVYTPAETPLLRRARRAGAAAVPGTELFAVQAAAQFEAFFGIRVPIPVVEEALA